MGSETYSFDQIDKNIYLRVLNSSIILFHKIKYALTICNNEYLNKNW